MLPLPMNKVLQYMEWVRVDSKKLFIISIGARLCLLTIASMFVIDQYYSTKSGKANTSVSIQNPRNTIGTEVDVPYDTLGFTELGKAASRGDIAFVVQYILKGLPISQQSQNEDTVTYLASGNTPLHVAIWDTNYDSNFVISQLLIASGAQVSIANIQGVFPLQRVIIGVNLQHRAVLLGMLIKHGADINARDSNGETIAHMACQDGENDWLGVLHKNFGLLIDFSIKNNKIDPYIKNNIGETVFQKAKNRGQNTDTFLDDLFTQYFDIYPGFDIHGVTGKPIATHIKMYEDKALSHPVKNIYVKVKEKDGGWVDVTGRDIMGLTLFMLAIIRKDKKFAQQLVDFDADPNAVVVPVQDEANKSLLRSALSQQSFSDYITKFIINTIEHDSEGNSSLHLALLHQSPDMVRFILDDKTVKGGGLKLRVTSKPIKTNIQNYDGDTPLHYVFKMRNDGYRIQAARALIQKELEMHLSMDEMSINIANKKGDTPNKGDTPLDVAVRFHAKGFIKFLIDEFLSTKKIVITPDNLNKTIELANGLALTDKDKAHAQDYVDIVQMLTTLRPK